MVKVKWSFFLLLLLTFIGVGLVVGIKVTQALMLTVVFEPIAPDRLFGGDQPLHLPTLQEIAGDAATDDQALDRIVTYYDSHREEIADNLNEENETRLKALFVMNVVHISHIYDSVSDPGSFLAYLAQSGSHCGTYSHYQAIVLDHFGVSWRLQGISGGTHTWVEVNVDGQWEMFDATTNTWINQSGAELMQGAERSYRAFYTPMLDPNREDVVNDYLLDAQRLRMLLPGLGLYYHPLAVIETYTL